MNCLQTFGFRLMPSPPLRVPMTVCSALSMYPIQFVRIILCLLDGFVDVVRGYGCWIKLAFFSSEY